MTTTKKSRARKASTSSTSNTPRYNASASKRAEAALYREKKQPTLKAGAASKAANAKTRDRASAINLAPARKANAKDAAQKAPARQTRSARQASSASRQKQA